MDSLNLHMPKLACRLRAILVIFLNWFLQIFRVLEFGLILGLLTVTSDFSCLFDKLSVTGVMNCAVFIRLAFFSENPRFR
jgi:hypothetical protein